MVAENYISNRRGTTRSSFSLLSPPGNPSSRLTAAAGELLIQTTAGAPAFLGSADLDLGAGFGSEAVNKFSNRFFHLLGQFGTVTAPFAGATVVGDSLLKATQPGFEGGAGPVLTVTDMAGPATNLSLAGMAGRWYGMRSVVAVPGLGEFSRGVGFAGFLYASINIPTTLDQSFFIGGLAAPSGALASGPDPSLAGLSGAMAIVKLAGDPTWNAFARIPGGGASKFAIGPAVATGTTYQFFIEASSISGAVRFTVLDASSTILGQIAFPGAAFGGAANHYHFDAGAYTAVAAARDFNFFRMSAVRFDSYDI